MTDTTDPPPDNVQLPEPLDRSLLDTPSAPDALDDMDVTPPIDEGEPPDEDDTPPAKGI